MKNVRKDEQGDREAPLVSLGHPEWLVYFLKTCKTMLEGEIA